MKGGKGRKKWERNGGKGERRGNKGTKRGDEKVES